ncbi:MAG: DUF2125 domain-containing protein [Alphaproteobacteria bacterium]
MKLVLRLIIIGILFCLLGAIAYYWWWHHLAHSVNQTISALIEDQRQQDYIIAFRAISINGFPGPLQITLNNPVIVANRGGPAPLTYWRWDGPTLHGWINVLAPREITFTATGLHKIDSVLGRTPQNLRLDAQNLTFVLKLDNNGHLQTIDMAARLVKGTIIETETEFTIENFTNHIENRKPVLISGYIRGGILNHEIAPGLGNILNDARWQMKIFEDFPTTGGAAGISLWQHKGGRIEVEDFSARAPSLEVNLQGPIALDEQLQPYAQFTGWMRGWGVLLQSLVANGSMSPSGSALANLALRALARPPAEGGPPAVHAPLSLRNRRVFLGPVNLGTVPPIHWE